MENKKNILIIIFSAIGLLLSIWLCKIYYDANFNPYALSSFCSVNDLIDCDGVAKTSFSQYLGIPLCLWGVFLYSFIFLLLGANKLKNIAFLKFLEVFKNPRAYIFSLSLLAFILSICLACISIFEIQKICVLCFCTYFTDLAIALSAKDFKKPLFSEINQSFADFREAIQIKKYLISFIVVMIIFAGVLFYFSQSKILTPQIMKYNKEHFSLSGIPHKENTLGKQNAKIVVKEFMDYNCASCFLTNITIRRLATELDGVIFIQHNMPLDSQCNRMVKKGHDGSCKMALYALAAKKQGKYWEANEILFDNTPNTEKDIIKYLSKIRGINKKQLIKDAHSEEIKAELNQEIEEGIKLGIDATPTTIINIQKHVGNIPYNKLKEELITAGATEKF